MTAIERLVDLYTATTWPHLHMLDLGWVVVGGSEKAIRLSSVGERPDASRRSNTVRPRATVAVYQQRDRWDLLGIVRSEAFIPPRPWYIALLDCRTRIVETIHGFASEEDARAIADRILAGCGAWDSPQPEAPEDRG